MQRRRATFQPLPGQQLETNWTRLGRMLSSAVSIFATRDAL